MGLIRKVTRMYTFHTPFKRGAYRLAEASLRFGGDVPDRMLVKASDGRELVIDPSDIGYKFVYFLGDYEPSISYFIRRSVSPGDTCLDLGANIGWFTTLLQCLSGENGSVHAFEPVPKTFQLLEENVNMNSFSEIVHMNNFALGESEGEVEMSMEAGKPDGHAFVSHELSGSAGVLRTKMTTLDKYLEQKKIGHVNFLKADIEGSELLVLKSGMKLFEQKVPPIMEVEMALDTSKRYGYIPNDFITFIKARGDYEFYAITEKNKKLTKIEGFGNSDPGANVLCVPAEKGRELRRSLGID